jgi:hypothetical protein
MKQSKCQHCNELFDMDVKPKGWMANHSRWCNFNPKVEAYKEKLSKVRKKITQQSRDLQARSLSKAHKRGAYKEANKKRKGKTGFKHSDETKKIISEKALTSAHRRLRKKMIKYKDVWLDSSWELYLAQRLDELGIKWIRPEPIKWNDREGKIHNYFADFYLPEYNLYLDPKNPYAIKVQREKLDCLFEQYRNIHIIDSENGCKQFILDGVAQQD